MPVKFLLPILLLSPLAHAADPAYELDRIENSKVYFKAPKEGVAPPAPIETKLSDVKFITTLKAPTSATWILVSGKPQVQKASSSEDERHIYAFRSDQKRSTHFIYPGKILDPKTRAVLFEARAFFGKCTHLGTEQYVVFQRERLDRRRSLQPSVFVAEPAKDFMEEKLLERRLPSLNTALTQVKRKTCTEIEGRNRLMLRKAMNLRPKKDGSDANSDAPDEDDDESDDTPKENQTAKEIPATTNTETNDETPEAPETSKGSDVKP